MFRSFRTAVCAAVAAMCMTVAPAAAETLVREKLPNDIGFELLGKGLAYSFYYQRTVSRFVGFEGGFGAIGGGADGDQTTVLFVPVGARLYAIPKNGSFFVSGGAVFINASTSSGPFDDSVSNTFGYVGPGFEFRAESGFLFRGTAYALLHGDGFFIWPGLTVGYSF